MTNFSHLETESSTRPKQHTNLPSPVSDNKSESPPGSQSPQSNNGSYTIFTVEDDAAVRGLVHEILEHHGYRVIDAPSGDAALVMWPSVRDQIDLLLTDMVMPGEHNGLDLAKKL